MKAITLLIICGWLLAATVPLNLCGFIPRSLLRHPERVTLFPLEREALLSEDST